MCTGVCYNDHVRWNLQELLCQCAFERAKMATCIDLLSPC
jgi:hypothetical protein